MDKKQLMELVAKVIPMLEDMASKNAKHPMHAPGPEEKGPDGPPSEAEAEDVAKDKVIVMMLGGEAPEEDKEDGDEYGC